MATLNEPEAFSITVLPQLAGGEGYPQWSNLPEPTLLAPAFATLSPEPDASDVRQGVAFGAFGERAGTMQAGGGSPVIGSNIIRGI